MGAQSGISSARRRALNGLGRLERAGVRMADVVLGERPESIERPFDGKGPIKRAKGSAEPGSGVAAAAATDTSAATTGAAPRPSMLQRGLTAKLSTQTAGAAGHGGGGGGDQATARMLQQVLRELGELRTALDQQGGAAGGGTVSIPPAAVDVLPPESASPQ